MMSGICCQSPGPADLKKALNSRNRAAILDRRSFERVQELLASKSNSRKKKRLGSGALLQGKLYDDRGNLMSPSFPPRTACATATSVSPCCGVERKRLDR
jgi:hypothetical protein